MPGSSSPTAILEGRKLRVSGPLPPTRMFIKSARVIEGLSQITETTVDFMSHDRALPLEDLVGQFHKVEIQTGDDEGVWRPFVGTCVEASYIGLHEGFSFFSLEIRPWIWFLTRTVNNRIFQNLSAIDIIRKIFADRGFSDYTVKLTRPPEVRIYTVQYNETDYAFICRLMEEEGIYFYSTAQNGKDMLMIVDGIGGHSPVEGAATIGFYLREADYRRADDHIFEWRGAEGVRSGKVTLRDYNFEKPRVDMTVATQIAKGKHSYRNFERYGYPGHYRETPLGEIRARVRMEAEAWPHHQGSAIGNVRTLATGATFTLKDHPRSGENKEYLITSAVHLMQVEVQAEDETQQVQDSGARGKTAQLPSTIVFEEDNHDVYRCTFRTIPKDVPYRAALTTPWPEIPGILLAKVTGPAGEEIHTDKYGRIKVQFPWDREGRNDENSSCWVRVVTPWAGVNWGMIAVPRIGQEVVIQFEDGDPDRPICTGMLYNADLMPPYGLPANMTQTGIVTRSTKGGGAGTFNELIFEDKKGEEFVRLQSEKDYKETIKNNAVITVGLEKMDPGDYTMTIHANRTETVKTGDSTFTVATGSEIRDIKTDKTETIGANSTKTVKGNLKSTVTGNETHAITGNNDKTVTGNKSDTVTGSITIESKQKIELKVGANSITIDPSGITIKGTMITTEASGMATHKSGGIMTIQGALVMIN